MADNILMSTLTFGESDNYKTYEVADKFARDELKKIKTGDLEQSVIDGVLDNAKAYTDQKIDELVDSAPGTMDTLKELADAIEDNGDLIDGLNTAIGNKANSADVYTKNETDRLLGSKADSTDLHTHSNATVIGKLSESSDGKLTYDGNLIQADLSTVYTKAETDNLLNAKANSTDLHSHTNKTVVDKFTEDVDGTLLFDGKKIEADVDMTSYYTKDETDGLLNSKANSSDLHTHANKTDVLDALGVTNGKLTFNGNTVGGGATINDSQSSTSTTYSSSKIDTLIPNVPDWAKQSTKPTYTASEVGALPSDTVIPTVTNDLTDELKTSYDEAVENSHAHENKEVIDKLTDDNGTLKYNGNAIGGGTGAKIDDSVIATTSTYSSNKIEQRLVDKFGELDLSKDFISEDGFGKIRYFAGKFEYFDTNSQMWVDLVFTGDNQYIMNAEPQPMKHISIFSDYKNNCIKLKFTEPANTIIGGQLVNVIKGIKIVRKLGSIPNTVDDGDLILTHLQSDFGKYQNTWFVDNTKDFTQDFEEENTYYYRFFPYNDFGVYSYDMSNAKSITCLCYELYAFKIDQTESDPSSMITYIPETYNENFKSAFMNYETGKFDYGDWENVWFIQDLKPCMLNYDGTVAYELNKNDYTKKIDGTPSDVGNISFAGNAMVGIPKVYYKCVKESDDIAYYYFSNSKVDEDYHCWSHIDANGNEIDYCYISAYEGSHSNSKLRSLSGKTIYSTDGNTEISIAKANDPSTNSWYTWVFSDIQLINLLLLLIGKNADTQTVFGRGNVASGNALKTGTMNGKGLFWGTNGDYNGVKVFGIENWWGNVWKRIAGLVSSSYNMKAKFTWGQQDGSTVDGYNTSGYGYISFGSISSSGYINAMNFTEYGLIPKNTNGSDSVSYCDNFYNYLGDYYAMMGGRHDSGSWCGAFSCGIAYSVSLAHPTFCASLSCKPLT